MPARLLVLWVFLFGACTHGEGQQQTQGDALRPYPPTPSPHISGGGPTTYYVRPDGGTADQCTGLINAPYPGSGLNQPCAWDHPFRALPPMGTPRISGGDTLNIAAGAYRMGYGAPGAEACEAAGSFDCTMPPIPGGPDPAHSTRILGDSQNPPELWGAERPWFILNLTDASNVEIGYLEITDHSGCIEYHSGGLACERENPPYGLWASVGLHAEDAANVTLYHLDIHGLASIGVHAGRLTDWTVEDVRIAGNGSAGWDGDLWDDPGDANSGTLTFRRWTVEWNGCGESWPGGQPTGCWGQSAGGYGDGVATGESGGHWIIEDSIIRYNTSDGLDFLYIRLPGSAIDIRRTLVMGNAGNQVKTFRGPFLLENSILIGNCGFFDGQPFTHNVDHCRALGTALDIGLTPGDQAQVINNTLTSEGDCLVAAECYGNCDGSEQALLRNNIFQGQVDFLQPFENTCLVYQETFSADPFDVDYSLIVDVKDDLCPGAHDICDVPLGLVNAEVDSFDAHLLASSPAINAALTDVAPPDDFDGRNRDPQPDIGAYEWWPPAAWVYLPWCSTEQWHAASPDFLPPMIPSPQFPQLQFAADGAVLLYAAANTVTAWDVAAGQLRYTCAGRLIGVSQSSHTFVTENGADAYHFWHSATGAAQPLTPDITADLPFDVRYRVFLERVQSGRYRGQWVDITHQRPSAPIQVQTSGLSQVENLDNWEVISPAGWLACAWSWAEGDLDGAYGRYHALDGNTPERVSLTVSRFHTIPLCFSRASTTG